MGRPPKIKNGIRRISAAEVAAMGEGKLFQIEKTPPPILRADQAAVQIVLQKVDRTVEHIEAGQAFIMPANIKNSVHRHLKENYPKNRFRFTAIPDNPNQMRIYRTQ